MTPVPIPPVPRPVQPVTVAANAWIERNTFAVFAVYSLLYFLHAFGASSQKRFWNDEYLVYWTAHLADYQTIWRSLREAPLPVDPPLYHFLAHLSLALPIPADLAVRLPSIVGFWLMLLGVFVIVRRRTDTIAALFAASVILASPAQGYAVEARPYGELAGCITIALLCWQTAARRNGNRFWPLFGLWASLTAALLSHYYAFISVGAILVGEAFRSRSLGKTDRIMWLCLTAPFLATLLWLPLLPAAALYRNHAQIPVTITALLECYELAFSPVLLPVLILAALLPFPESSTASQPESDFTMGERAASLALFLAPVAGFALGRFVTRAYAGRYTLPFVAGSAILLGLGFRRLAVRQASGVALLIATGTAAFSVKTGIAELIRHAPPVSAQIAKLDPESFRRNPSLPIAISRGEVFFSSQFYANPAWKDRCVGIVSTDAASSGPGSFEQMALASLLEWSRKGWSALPMQDLTAFTRQHRRFLLWSDGDLPDTLRKQSAQLQWLAVADGTPVFLVTLPPDPAP